MKTTIALLILTFLMSCGGSLSDEQRKEMHKKMEMNKIVRVTEVEIMEAALTKGRDIIQTIEELEKNPSQLDSFVRIHRGSIRFIVPGVPGARDLERQLLEAYLADSSGSLQDNVQKLRNASGEFDSVLYTKPVLRTTPEGNDELQGVWNLWLSKKDLVLEASKHK
jgi:hypothetical protein